MIKEFKSQKIKMDIEIPSRFKDASIENIDKSIADYVKNMVSAPSTKGLYISGVPGVGKTYTAYAIYKYFYSLGMPVRIYKSLEIVDSIKKGIASFYGPSGYSEGGSWRDDVNFIEDLINFPGVLIIDDIGVEKCSDQVQIKYFQIIDSLYDNESPLILTSNLPLLELSKELGKRTYSRIGDSCTVIKLNATL